MKDATGSERDLGDGAALRELYRSAEPFEHIVLDDVLDDDTLRAAIAEFPDLAGAQWNNYLHINERKYSNPRPETWGPTLRKIGEQFMTPEFLAFVEALSGFEGLIADPDFDGGGLHRSIHGGYLNVHTDFTVHHTHRDWQRRVNLLLYLNEDWQPEYGGDLEFWTSDMSRCVTKVAPVANRMLLFTTTEESFHGHPTPMNLPKHVARKSLALYYFTKEESVSVKSTNYRGRPEDGWRRLLVYADKQALHGYDIAKRRLHLSDDAVSTTMRRVQHLFKRGRD